MLNIISALLTNFYIDGATRQANDLLQQQQANDKLINLVWQQIETLERKREHTLVLLAASDMAGQVLPDPVREVLQQDIANVLPDLTIKLTMSEIPYLMQQFDRVQQSQREKINMLYFDNQGLIKQNAGKMESISILRNLALFLQIMGLALILARDLNRRDYAR